MLLQGIKGKNEETIILPREINLPDNIDNNKDSEFYFEMIKAISKAWVEDVNMLQDKLMEAQTIRRG